MNISGEIYISCQLSSFFLKSIKWELHFLKVQLMLAFVCFVCTWVVCILRKAWVDTGAHMWERVNEHMPDCLRLMPKENRFILTIRETAKCLNIFHERFLGGLFSLLKSHSVFYTIHAKVVANNILEWVYMNRKIINIKH